MKTRAFWVVVLGILVLRLKSNRNNVCKTFEDYYSNRDENPNCYHNADHELEVPEIVMRYGYPIEVHNVTTSDGYILTVFRIPHGIHTNTTSKKPVFLQHGLAINSGSFLITGRKSLGFMLADAGYDVWLGNFRGSKYSNNHVYLDNQSEAFWNFSIQENGLYDLPAQINFVSNVTKQKIAYLGYSMGTTAAYIYLSTYPNEKKIDMLIGLAPAIYFYNVDFIEFFSKIWVVVAAPIQFITNGKMYPRMGTIFKYLCFPYPIQMEMCQLFDMLIMGFSYAENDPETLPVSLLYNSDSASVNTFWHIEQLRKARKFQSYDYGETGNLLIYNSATPPPYNMSNINIDNHLFYADNDKLATATNVKLLYDDLQKTSNVHKLYRIENEYFNHANFLSGKNAGNLLYMRILKLLDITYK